jgi:hypothetical protein
MMDALAAAHGAAVQMTDTSIVSVHQHGASQGTSAQSMKKGAWANIPPKSNRSDPIASPRTSIAFATMSNGSSAGSNNVVEWRRATTGLRKTILPSSSSHLSDYGWLRPNESAP